jgi:hypothetical protein
MASRRWVVVVLLVLLGWSPAAQQRATPQFQPGYVDPQPVLAAARKAVGVDNLKCVTMSGTGYAGMVGQQRLNDKDLQLENR